MLPRVHRLQHSADFSRVIRAGRRAASATLVVHVVPAEDTKPTRIGFIVSRSVGNAVVRNRLRRRLRHLAAPVTERPGLAVVIRANPAAVTRPSVQLGADLHRLLDQALQEPARP